MVRCWTTATRTRRWRNFGNHQPAGPYRGGKYSVWEGGTRTPFITHWKGHLRQEFSDQLVCTVDLAASFAALVGQSLDDKACLDSMNVLDALLGKYHAQGRDHLLQQDNGSGNFGLRTGRLEARASQTARPSPRRSLASRIFAPQVVSTDSIN